MSTLYVNSAWSDGDCGGYEWGVTAFSSIADATAVASSTDDIINVENLELSSTLYGGGYDMVFGEGFETSSYIYGGGNQTAITTNINLTFNDGVYDGMIYGGGNCSSVTGDVSITINGGTFSKAITCSGYGSDSVVTGNTYLYITGGTIKANVLTVNLASSSTTGTAYISISGGSITGNVQGGKATGGTTIDISGGTISGSVMYFNSVNVYSNITLYNIYTVSSYGSTEIYIAEGATLTLTASETYYNFLSNVESITGSGTIVLSGVTAESAEAWAEAEGITLAEGVSLVVNAPEVVYDTTTLYVDGTYTKASTLEEGLKFGTNAFSTIEDAKDAAADDTTSIVVTNTDDITDRIYCDGYATTFGDDVKIDPFIIAGSGTETIEDGTNITIEAGADLATIYLGGDGQLTNGDCTLTINGGTIGTSSSNIAIRAGGLSSAFSKNTATVTGNVSIIINDGTIYGKVCASGSYSSIDGNSTITINGGTIVGDIVTFESYSYVSGETTINVNGGVIDGAINGTYTSSTGTSTLNLAGGQVNGDISYIDTINVTADTTVTNIYSKDITNYPDTVINIADDVTLTITADDSGSFSCLSNVSEITGSGTIVLENIIAESAEDWATAKGITLADGVNLEVNVYNMSTIYVSDSYAEYSYGYKIAEGIYYGYNAYSAIAEATAAATAATTEYYVDNVELVSKSYFNGCKVTFGSNVELPDVDPTTTYDPTAYAIYGGAYNESVDSSKIVIEKDAATSYVYAGSVNVTNTDTYTDTETGIDILGVYVKTAEISIAGSADSVFAGGHATDLGTNESTEDVVISSTVGTSTINVTDGALIETLYGGSHTYHGTTTGGATQYSVASVGEANLNVSGGNVINLFAGGKTGGNKDGGNDAQYANIVEVANIEITGGTVKYIYGGAKLLGSDNYAVVEEANITVSDGCVYYIYGGGYGNADSGDRSGDQTSITNTVTITIEGNAVIGGAGIGVPISENGITSGIYAGGYLCPEFDDTLIYVDSATINIDGGYVYGIISGDAYIDNSNVTSVGTDVATVGYSELNITAGYIKADIENFDVVNFDTADLWAYYYYGDLSGCTEVNFNGYVYFNNSIFLGYDSSADFSGTKVNFTVDATVFAADIAVWANYWFIGESYAYSNEDTFTYDADTTFTVNNVTVYDGEVFTLEGETYIFFADDNAIWADNITIDTVYVNSAYDIYSYGDYISDGIYYGYNAYSTIDDGLAGAVENESSTIILESDVTFTKSFSGAISFLNEATITIDMTGVTAARYTIIDYTGTVAPVSSFGTVVLENVEGYDYYVVDGDLIVTNEDFSNVDTTTAYVSSNYAGKTLGDSVGDGLVYGVNAFSDFVSGKSYTNVIGGDIVSGDDVLKYETENIEIILTDVSIGDSGRVYTAGKYSDSVTAEISDDVSLTISGTTSAANTIIYGAALVTGNSALYVGGDISVTIDSSTGEFNEVYGGGAIDYTASKIEILGYVNVTISAGTFTSIVGTGTKCLDGTVTIGSIDTPTGTNLTITGGTFEYIVYGGAYSQGGTATIFGDCTTTISGGTFNANVYGGSLSYTSTLSSLSIIEGSVIMSVDSSENAIQFDGDIYVGSYSSGTVTGDIEITFTGNGDNLTFAANSSVYGESSSGANKSLISGDRCLIFDAFEGKFNAGLGYFTNIEISKDSSVIITGEADDAVALSSISSWTFGLDADSTALTLLDNGTDITNNFTGDDIILEFSTDDLANDIDGMLTVLDAETADALEGFESLSSVTMIIDETTTLSASYSDGAWVSADGVYSFSIDDDDSSNLVVKLA